jgi:serine kinase of HPr protein (carbohydrate metabolism regulator)
VSNIHGTALVALDHGILIMGASGAGKTTLALDLLARVLAAGRHAALLADDQVLLSRHGDRLVAAAPAAIAGLVETRGRPPQPVRSVDRAVIDLVVRLVPEAEAPRYADAATIVLEGCAVASLDLARRGTTAASQTLLSWLGLPPFAAAWLEMRR